MARVSNKRIITCIPDFTIFKPKGMLNKSTEVIHLSLDEMEAVRLIDYNGLYHDDAAKKMNVSRATVGRIVESARKKISDALVNGKILKIGGGEVCIKTTDELDAKNCVFCPVKIEEDEIHEKCTLCKKT